MKNMPLSPKTCPKTINDIVMMQKLIETIQDPLVPQHLKDLAIMGLDLAIQSHNETNPTSH
jgi:hypothetical protein